MTAAQGPMLGDARSRARWHFRRGIAGGVLISLIVLGGCSGRPGATLADTVPSPGPTAAAAATTPPGPAPTAPPALVGTWVGQHNCERMVEDLRAFDLDSQILPAVVGNGLLPGVTDPAGVRNPDKPCVGAIDLEHAHFFTAAGEFGSLDQYGNPVDDGSWSIVDSTTFAINDVPFGYEVTGNELRLEPIDVGACPDPEAWCLEAWKVMVAMPGMAWTRE